MSTDKPKSASKTGPKGAADPSSKSGATGDKSTGRVKFDERGNAVWEWQISTGAFGREVSTARLKKLQNPTLSIADDAPTPFDKVRAEIEEYASRKAQSDLVKKLRADAKIERLDQPAEQKK